MTSIPAGAFKRGTRFLHARWLATDQLTGHLVCEVTRVAQGVVYWKQPGERKAHSYFRVEDAGRYVKEILP